MLTFGKYILNQNGYSWVAEKYLQEWCYKRLEQSGAEITIDGKKIKINKNESSRKKATNKWFETQDSISYWDDFNKQKIIWIELADKGRFAVDLNDNYLTLNGTFIMTGVDLEYICCVLNNPLTSWHFNTYCISSGVGTNQWRELYVRKLFIPDISQADKIGIVSLFKKVIRQQHNADLSTRIQEINKTIYNLLRLDEEEIEFIECQ